MVEIKQLADTGVQSIITLGAALADGSRKAALYTNDTELDIWCDVFLLVQYDTIITAGTQVGVLYLLPGDGAGTEIFPIGGDGSVGVDIDPQAEFVVGTFTSIQPSVTVNESLGLPNIPMPAQGMRFVFKNTCGQDIDSGMTMKILPKKIQSV